MKSNRGPNQNKSQPQITFLISLEKLNSMQTKQILNNSIKATTKSVATLSQLETTNLETAINELAITIPTIPSLSLMYNNPTSPISRTGIIAPPNSPVLSRF